MTDPSEAKKRKAGWPKGRLHSPETKAKMRATARGEGNPRWGGGRSSNGAGYACVWMPDHPYCDRHGYVLEHRLIVEKQIGRYLTKEEQVHHINGKKDDNRSENLYLFPNNSAHRLFHFPKTLLPKIKSNLF